MYRRILRARSGTDVKMPRASRSRSIFENQSSTWLSHDEYVGVKRQRDHVGGLCFEVGIVRLHVAFEAMRLQAGTPPRLRDQVVMNVEQPREFAGTPMRAAVGRRVPRLLEDARFHLGR